MDFISALRLRSLLPPNVMGNDLPEQGGFGGNMSPGPGAMTTPPMAPPMMSQNPFTTSNAPTPEEAGIYDVGRRMKELYTPEDAASTRLNTMLDSYPGREKPSGLRKLAAGLVAATQGAEAGSNVLRNAGGRNQKLKDWNNQIGPIERAATLEKGNNSNQRQLAYQTIAAELKQQAQDAKETNDAKKIEIAQHRAQIYDFKARNPNLKILTPKGGNIQFYNPATGETKDSGIPTGSLSELDKMNLGHEQRTEEITQKGNITSTQIGQRGEEARKTAKVRGEEARTTKSTPSGNITNPKVESPTQTRVRQFNAARELANTDPELRKFIKIGNPGSNDFTVAAPGTNFFGSATGPTPEQYKKIQQAIYGVSTTTSHESKPLTKTQKNRNTGETRVVESTDGGKTWHPQSQKTK